MVKSITVLELNNQLKSNTELFLLDVRTKQEYEIANLKGYLIPLHELQERFNELQNVYIVVYCHHGVRSLQAVNILESNGFTNVYNLQGGIDAWSRFVDPKVPRYM